MRFHLWLLILVLFAPGCGGGSLVPGGKAAPAPGPSARMNLRVGVSLARTAPARGNTSQVLVEVVAANAPDPGTFSHLRLVGSGQAPVDPGQSRVDVTVLDLVPGTWEVYVFGLDTDGQVVAESLPFRIDLFPGAVLEHTVVLQPVGGGQLTLSPANPSIVLGTNVQFQALDDGVDVTGSVRWTSSDPSVASITPQGLAAGLALGTVTITADGFGTQATTQLTVRNATLLSLSVAPATATVPAGFTQQFTATGTFDDGTTQDLSATVSWASSGPEASVNAAGLATALVPGTATVSASFGGLTARATLTVTAAVLNSIAVTPASQTFVSSFAPRQYTATGSFSDGSSLDLTAQVSWASTNPAVATLSNTPGLQGRLTSTGVGTVNVQATLNGVTGVTDVTIQADSTVRFPARFVLPQATIVRRFALGDLNGDGSPDLLTGGPSGTGVQLGNGDGSFQTPTFFAAGNTPDGIAVGDVNGDGNQDVVTSVFALNGLQVQLGNGNGTLQAPVTFAGGSGTVGVKLGDLDGDLDLDAVAAESLNQNASVRFNNGAGVFGGPTLLPMAGFNTSDVALVDLDGDSDLDLVSCCTGVGNDVGYRLNNGAGIFGGATTLNLGLAFVSLQLAAGDFDGDGDKDLAASNNGVGGPFLGQAAILVNNGAGGLNAPTYQTMAATSQQGITAADFNGDGAVDLACGTADEFTSLAPGNGNGTFQPFQRILTCQQSDGVGFGDLNGDGRADLITSHTGGPLAYSVLLGSPTGLLAQIRSDLGLNQGPSQVALGDFNQDGAPDAATAGFTSNNLLISLGNGDGSFQAPTGFGVGASPKSVAVGDWNGDGRLDLAVANNGSNTVTVLLGNGAGSFAVSSSPAVGVGPDCVVGVDLDGDGRRDLVTANQGSNNLSVLLGNGNGTFTPAAPVAVPGGPTWVQAPDLDQDGVPDLVAVVPGSSQVATSLGAGAGAFGVVSISLVGGANPNTVAAGRLNADAFPDVVVSDTASNDVHVLLGNGDGTLQAATAFPVASNLPNVESPTFVSMRDLNADGRNDIITVNNGQSSGSVLLGNGDGTLQTGVLLAAGSQPTTVAIGDLNGDGPPDLVFCSPIAAGFQDALLVLLALPAP